MRRQAAKPFRNFDANEKTCAENSVGQTNGRDLLDAKFLPVPHRGRIDLLLGNQQEDLMPAAFQNLGHGQPREQVASCSSTCDHDIH